MHPLVTLNFLLPHSLDVEDLLPVLTQSSLSDSVQEFSTTPRLYECQTDPN